MHFPTTTLLTLLLTLTTTPLVLAHPPIFAPNHATLQKRCPPFDPAGVKNIGNGAGTQFIGGQCLSAADCASGCCANPCGICSGVGAQDQAGKTGCGFGGSGSGKATTGTGTSSTGAGTSSGTGTGTSSGTSSGSGEGVGGTSSSGTTSTGGSSSGSNTGSSSCNLRRV